MPRHHLMRRTAQQGLPESDSPQPQLQPRSVQPVDPQLQYTTPPQRATAASLQHHQHPQLHPSSGPTADPHRPLHRPHPAAAAQAAIMSMFGRGGGNRGQRRPMEMMDEEDPEESEELVEEEEEERRFMGQAEGDFEEDDGGEMVGEEELEEDEEEVDDDDDDDDGDELMEDREKSPSPLPSNLREISSLASWTVSTHKPGCGVAALRHPSPTQYWQSDGPQPHTLTLHFFKLVAVVKIRVYLDFELDESYTPTKMIFCAGMGGNDLVEFATWEGEAPCGWVDVPLEGVGGRNGGWATGGSRPRRRRSRRNTRSRTRSMGKKGGRKRSLGDDYIFSDEENQADYEHRHGFEHDDDDGTTDDDDDDDPYAGNVLKAMVIQMRIMENHQNGKDTHVRGFQVFARDDDRRRMGYAPSASATSQTRRQSVRKSLRGGVKDGSRPHDDDMGKITSLEEPDWMGEPIIR